MRDQRKRFYSKGLTCQCCDAPIVNNNRSGVCGLCQQAIYFANRTDYTPDFGDEDPREVARDALRVFAGVRL